MKRVGRVLVMAAMASVWLAASVWASQYADLLEPSGSNERPTPNASKHRAGGSARIDTVKNVLGVDVTHDIPPDSVTAAHIHGFADRSGSVGVKQGLTVSGNRVFGTWNYSQADEASILAGLTYVNIHTRALTGGELRDQIEPVVVSYSDSLELSGANERPTPNQSKHTGAGNAWIDAKLSVLTVDVTHDIPPDSVTAAHIHGFADRSGSVGVKQGLTIVGNRVFGSWNYNVGAGDPVRILEGLTYVNIHTRALPGGELRDQIEPNKGKSGPVPSLSQWGMMALAALLLTGGALYTVRRRRYA